MQKGASVSIDIIWHEYSSRAMLLQYAQQDLGGKTTKQLMSVGKW